MEGARQLERDLGLTGTHENFYLERTAVQDAYVVWLNILEIDQQEIGFQIAPIAQHFYVIALERAFRLQKGIARHFNTPLPGISSHRINALR
jgi:hypothetical protein